MRPPLRIALLLGGMVLLVALCRHLGLAELASALGRTDPLRLLGFLVLTATVFTVYALRWAVVLRAMSDGEPSPGLMSLVAFRAAQHAVSTLLPSAQLSGEPVRAFLLRRRGIDWVRSIASVAMDRMLDVTATSIVGPIYVGIFFFSNDGASAAGRWILGLLVLAAASLAAFYVHAYRGGTLLAVLGRRGLFPSLAGHLEAIDRRLGDFLHTPSFAAGLALSFAAELLVLAEIWTLASAFELPISLPTLVGVLLGMGVAQTIPVPAALGSLEAAEVGVLALAGGAAPLGLAVGLIIRLRETLWIAVGLGALYLEGLSWRGAALASPAIQGSASAIDSSE